MKFFNFCDFSPQIESNALIEEYKHETRHDIDKIRRFYSQIKMLIFKINSFVCLCPYIQVLMNFQNSITFKMPACGLSHPEIGVFV